MIHTGIEFRSVLKVYDGRKVLDDISFVIRRGQHTAILGPSGCGKSTALRLLAGLEAPSSGQILFDDAIVSEGNRVVRPAHERSVSMVFQDLALWPNLSVFENVRLGLAATTLSWKDAAARARDALARCGIAELAARKPGKISGGQQQRAALARALGVRPSFLLLDEPFAGVDLATRSRLLEEISRLAAERDVTIILVSHDPLEATALCRSAVVLEEGHVREAGELTTLLENPQSEILSIFRNQLAALRKST